MSPLLRFRRRRRRARSVGYWLARILAVAAIAAIVISVLPVVSLRWIDPPTSSFMLQRKLGGLLDGETAARVEYRWVPWRRVSAAVPLAVVAAEDQRFPEHRGFDVVEIQNALAERQTTGRLRGASTISQQVAKNLFLWAGRTWVRKGLEVYLTVLIELSWSKRRILEVYLNIAQFGENTFGVGAASERFFHKPPSALTLKEAALLAAVLPNPVRMRVDKPSPYVRERAAFIQQQARRLGADFLAAL